RGCRPGASVPATPDPHPAAAARDRLRAVRRRGRPGRAGARDRRGTVALRHGSAPQAALAGAEQDRCPAAGAARTARRGPDAAAAPPVANRRAGVRGLGRDRRRVPRTDVGRARIPGAAPARARFEAGSGGGRALRAGRRGRPMSGRMSALAAARRAVVKVGSSLVTDEGRGLDPGAIARWAAQISTLHELGKQVVLVSSGAIAEGMQRLGWSRRPQQIHELQAAAAVGQMGLAQAYESGFAARGLRSAQVLLTHADLADRARYLNARSTL